MNRSRYNWCFFFEQLSLAISNVIFESISTYVDYKGNLLQQILTVKWMIQTLSSLPLFIGVSLQCRLEYIKQFLEYELNNNKLNGFYNILNYTFSFFFFVIER